MQNAVDQLLAGVNQVLLGKEHQVKLAVSCLLANGHILLEDLPGMGKTTLSHTLAKLLACEYRRIQFTSDLLPSDILGVTVFDQQNHSFEFRPGPIFSQVILADEINRATPKAQSALLEAMEEQQVSVDGHSHQLPTPFFVIATQNPSTQMGTFPLPESQLDRFLMKVSLGYPTREAERSLILSQDRRSILQDLEGAMTIEQLTSAQIGVRGVHISHSVVDYVQRLVSKSRSGAPFHIGISPRGTLALVQAARAWAYLHHRSHVVPEDIQAVLPSVFEHRLRGSANQSGHDGVSLVNVLLNDVDVLHEAG